MNARQTSLTCSSQLVISTAGIRVPPRVSFPPLCTRGSIQMRKKERKKIKEDRSSLNKQGNACTLAIFIAAKATIPWQSIMRNSQMSAERREVSYRFLSRCFHHDISRLRRLISNELVSRNLPPPSSPRFSITAGTFASSMISIVAVSKHRAPITRESLAITRSLEDPVISTLHRLEDGTT